MIKKEKQKTKTCRCLFYRLLDDNSIATIEPGTFDSFAEKRLSLGYL